MVYLLYTKILHIYDRKEKWLKFYKTNLEKLLDAVDLDVRMQDKILNVIGLLKAYKV